MTMGNNGDDDLHDEAEEIRKETAAASPELAEHDRLAELEKALEEANSKALYAAADTQNVRRRLEAEKAQAAAYAALASRAICWRLRTISNAPWWRCPTSFAPTEAASFLAGTRRPRATESAFARNGITRSTDRREARPHRHQARWRSRRSGRGGSIVEEMQWAIVKERLLRPALVGVARTG